MFDPWHRWLGIPPEEQPANYYRLLGLKQFESDHDVIDAAADQRLLFVRQSAAGKYAEYAQTVLNELSAARVCLLNPEKKAEYDRQLRQRLPAKPVAIPKAKAIAVSTPPSSASATASEVVPVEPVPATPVIVATRARRKSTLSTTTVVAIVATIFVVGGAAFAIYLNQGSVPLAETPNEPSEKVSVVEVKKSETTVAAKEQRLEEPKAATPPVVQPALSESEPESPPSTEPITPPTSEPSLEPAKPAKPELQVPVLQRSASAKALLILGHNVEFNRAKSVCEEVGMPWERGRFSKDRNDYSDVHAIVVGTNEMDYWGGGPSSAPEAFQHIDAFVRGGGHLVVFGTYNGRNLGQLKRYGIWAGSQHNDFFAMTGEASEVFFRGRENLIPSDYKLRSAGDLGVSNMPHVVLLKRGPGNSRGTPALVTIPIEKGRVTFTEVEPEWFNDFWFLQAVMYWVARGGPTRATDVDAKPTPGLPRSLASLLPASNEGSETKLASIEKAPRQAVPSAEEQKEARALATSIYKDRLAKAKNATEKNAICEEVYQAALNSRERPVEQYVLLQEAYKMSLAFKIPKIAYNVVDTLDRNFEVDGIGLKVELAKRVAKDIDDAPTANTFLSSVLDLAADRLDVDDVDNALSLYDSAKVAQRKATNEYLKDLVEIQSKRIAAVKKARDEVSPHLQDLEKTKLDPVASLAAGKYLYLLKGDLVAGLSLLLHCGDEELEQLAKWESDVLQASQYDEQLGDGWLKVAGRLSGAEQAAARNRARYWYQQAFGRNTGLKQEMLKTKLEKIPSRSVKLKILVKKHDGEERIQFSPQGTRWSHISWEMPQAVELNGVPWNIRKMPLLMNRGSSQFLPPDIDLSTIRVERTAGKSKLAAKFDGQVATVVIYDLEKDVDDLEFVVSFGK